MSQGAGVGFSGGGATHAWLEVFLPGAVWVEYDPTNGLVGSACLIRIAVARDASQAVPIAGSFTDRPGDMVGMRVEVEVRDAQSPEADAAQPPQSVEAVAEK